MYGRCNLLHRKDTICRKERQVGREFIPPVQDCFPEAMKALVVFCTVLPTEAARNVKKIALATSNGTPEYDVPAA